MPTRAEKLQENARQFYAGDIGKAELTLRQFGEYGGYLGDLGEMLTDPIMNASILGTGMLTGGQGVSLNDLLNQGMEQLSKTPVGQAAARYAQENPRTVQNTGSAFNILSAIPVLRAPAKYANSLLRNTDTMVQGGALNVPFYGGGRGQQVLSFIGETAEAIPDTLFDMFMPSRIATARETGLGTKRREEISTTKEGEASAVAGDYMQRQEGSVIDNESGASFVSQGPIGDKNFIATGLNAKKQKSEVRQFIGGEDIPDNVADFHVNDVYNAHGVYKKSNPVEIAVSRPEAATGTQISIGKEATGTSSVSSLLGRAFSGNFVDKYANFKKMLLKDADVGLTKRDQIEIAQVAGSLNKNTIRHIYTSWKNMEGNFDLVERQRLVGGATRFEKPKISAADQKVEPADVLETILKARLKEQNGLGNKLTDKEIFYLSEWERLGANRTRIFDSQGNRIDADNIADIAIPEGPIHLSTSHYSSAKALGGVRDTVSLDFDNGKMYTTISDGHDMFGVDPMGGHGLITVVPTQVTNIGKKTYDSKRARSRTKEEYTKQQMEAAKRLERISGIPMKPNENPLAYNRRVIGEYKAEAQRKDYVTAAGNIAEAGIIGFQTDNDNQ